MHIKLLKLFSIHLSIYVHSRGEVGCLQSLHLQLVLQCTQLILVQLMGVVSWAHLIWELFSIYLIEEISELSRHCSFLGIDPD